MTTTKTPIGGIQKDYHKVYIDLGLAQARKEIRILTITPGDYDDDNIDTGMSVASLEHGHVDFNALSYAWEPPNSPIPQRTIQINRHPFKVSATVFMGLQKVRWYFKRNNSPGPINLWVDSICINQESNAEKNHQVPLMSDIYSSASLVIVWLGDCDSAAASIMSSMQDFNASLKAANTDGQREHHGDHSHSAPSEAASNDEEQSVSDVSDKKDASGKLSASFEKPDGQDEAATTEMDLDECADEAIVDHYENEGDVHMIEEDGDGNETDEDNHHEADTGHDDGTDDESDDGTDDESDDDDDEASINLYEARSFLSDTRQLFQRCLQIYNRAWFGRTWILQEVALAEKPPIVLCGNIDTDFHSLVNAGKHICGHPIMEKLRWAQGVAGSADLEPLYYELHEMVHGPILWIKRLRSSFQAAKSVEGGLPLGDLLARSRLALATNPRDKVYGILSLAGESVQKSITVDYDKTVTEVYEDATSSLIKAGDSFHVLSMISQFQRPQQEPHWPTWIPYFGDYVRNSGNTLVFVAYPRACSGYKASGHLPAIHSIMPKHTLVLWGLQVDRVHDTNDYWPSVPETWAPGEEVFAPRLEGIVELFYGHGRDGNSTSSDDNIPCPEATYAPRLRHHGPIHGSIDQEIIVQSAVKPLYEAIWRCLIGNAAGLDNRGRPVEPKHVPASEFHRQALCEWIRRVLPTRHEKFWLPHSEGDPPRLGAGSPRIGNVPRISDPLGFEEEDRGYQGSWGPGYRRQLLVRLADIWDDRKAFITRGGWIGFGPRSMEPGDAIAVIVGSGVPFVLRSNPKRPGAFLMVGECYVEGLMLGELFGQCEDCGEPLHHDNLVREERRVKCDGFQGTLDVIEID